MPLIASLRSLDDLLNRFDDLSHQHVQLIEQFDHKFSDVDNPLRRVDRKQEEQQLTQDKLRLRLSEDDDDDDNRPRAIGDFHRSVKITRFLHRPPSYSSIVSNVSFPLPPTIRETSRTVDPRVSLTKGRWTNPVHHPTDPHRRRYGRSPITFFSMETVNRLSKPRVYHHSPIKPVRIAVPMKKSRPVVHLSSPTPISLKFPMSAPRSKVKPSRRVR